MNIIERIEDAAHRNVLAGPRKGLPEFLLLGANEWSELRAVCAKFEPKKSAPFVPRMIFRDMEVFRVDAPNFIGFGFGALSPCG